MINKEPKHNTNRTDTETQKGGPKHHKPASNDGTPTLIIQTTETPKGRPRPSNQYMTYLTPDDTDRAPTGHRRDTDGTPASNETPTAGTKNTVCRTHCVHESNKHTRRILNSISFSNSHSHSAPTRHRRDTDWTPASDETPTAGTENPNETQTFSQNTDEHSASHSLRT